MNVNPAPFWTRWLPNTIKGRGPSVFQTPAVSFFKDKQEDFERAKALGLVPGAHQPFGWKNFMLQIEQTEAEYKAFFNGELYLRHSSLAVDWVVCGSCPILNEWAAFHLSKRKESVLILETPASSNLWPNFESDFSSVENKLALQYILANRGDLPPSSRWVFEALQQDVLISENHPLILWAKRASQEVGVGPVYFHEFTSNALFLEPFQGVWKTTRDVGGSIRHLKDSTRDAGVHLQKSWIHPYRKTHQILKDPPFSLFSPGVLLTSAVPVLPYHLEGEKVHWDFPAGHPGVVLSTGTAALCPSDPSAAQEHPYVDFFEIQSKIENLPRATGRGAHS